MSDIILPIDGDIRPLEAKLNRIASRSINLNLKDSISQPLGRITGKVSEFDKSLEASNARVLAFGASAGAVYAVGRAFQEIVKSTIDVEKSLADINVVLNASSQQLNQFGSNLFGIAKNTGQSFGEVAKAATEFSRQGLGIAETLKRTSDALILTRLSGLDAKDSVEALTAAVNGFARVGLTTTEIINKLATVDAAFAVSTADLANALSRVGSTAQDAGVGFDQLISIVTAAQQTTARGGAVIGNSLKTIFTRLQRTDTLDELEKLGIAVRDLEGNTLPAIQILKGLASTFSTLSDAQRASVAETVGGVFQINILRAALGDLSKEYSIYDSALKTSATATNQAIERNKALNDTLSALVNKTFVNLTQSAAKIGDIVIAPTLKGNLGAFNNILEGFNKPEEAEGIGTKVAVGLLKGISSYLSGPGLAVVGAVFLNIFKRLSGFSAEALKGLLGISSQADVLAQAMNKVNTILAQNPVLIDAITKKQMSLLEVENQILKIIQAQNNARSTAATISAAVAPKIIRSAGTSKTKSFGFVPNFSPEMQEVMGAEKGGYKAGNIKRMNIQGEGRVIYNDAESVVRFPGTNQPAIIPPENSKAGKDYRKQFEKEAGFDPYASKGFIPNFANKMQEINAAQFATMLVPQGSKTTSEYTFLDKNKKPMINVTWPVVPLATEYKDNNVMTDISEKVKKVAASLMKNYARRIQPPARNYSQEEIISKINSAGGAKGSLNSFAGAIFEAGTNLALDYTAAAKNGLNFDVIGRTKELASLFPGFNTDLADYKINATSPDNRESMAKKILSAKKLGYMTEEGKYNPKAAKNAAIISGRKQRMRRSNRIKSANTDLPLAVSRGFIPNFSALQDAIEREKKAGVNPSKIRVGSDNSLISRDNPYGLGVYNTKDEPGGLKQGIDRSKSQGYIPNYAKKGDLQASVEIQNTEGFDKFQSKLLSLGIALQLATGVTNQFADKNNQTIATINDLANSIANAATAFAIGGKRFGLLLAGGMAGLSIYNKSEERRNEPFTKEIEKLNASLDVLRTSASTLEGALSKSRPALNNWIDELSKPFPDASEIDKFKSEILEAIEPLGNDLKNKILNSLNSASLDQRTPKNIDTALSQALNEISQNRTMTANAQALISSRQKQAQEFSNFDSILNQMAIRFKGIARDITGNENIKVPELKITNPFENKDYSEQVSRSFLSDILSKGTSAKDQSDILAGLSKGLADAGNDGGKFLEVIKKFSTESEITQKAFQNLLVILSNTPEGINQFAKSMTDSIKTINNEVKANLPKETRYNMPTKGIFPDIEKLYNLQELEEPSSVGGTRALKLMSAGGMSERYREAGLPVAMGREVTKILGLANSMGINLEQYRNIDPEGVKAAEANIRDRSEKEFSAIRTMLEKRPGFDQKAFDEAKANLTKPGFEKGVLEGFFGKTPADSTTFKSIEDQVKEINSKIAKEKEQQEAVQPIKDNTKSIDNNTDELKNREFKLSQDSINQFATALKDSNDQNKNNDANIQRIKDVVIQTLPVIAGVILAQGGVNLGRGIADLFTKGRDKDANKSVLKILDQISGFNKTGAPPKNIEPEKLEKKYYSERDPKTGRFIKKTAAAESAAGAAGETFVSRLMSFVTKGLKVTAMAGIGEQLINPSDAGPSKGSLGYEIETGLRDNKGNLTALGKEMGLPEIAPEFQNLSKETNSLTDSTNETKNSVEDLNSSVKNLDNTIKTAGQKGLLPRFSSAKESPRNSFGATQGISSLQNYSNEDYENIFSSAAQGKSYRPQNVFDQAAMGQYENVPEISRAQSSKFERLTNAYKESEKIDSNIGGDSRIDNRKFSVPSELMKDMTPEQQHNAQIMSLEKIMNENASAQGYNPYTDYGRDIAPYKRAIDELEGGKPRRGFEEPGTIGFFEQTRQKQLNKGFSSKQKRLEEQRKTGMIDSGFEKGYAAFGLDRKLKPEDRILSRSYDPRTGMITNTNQKGEKIGLESEIRQREKQIFIETASKKYAEQAKQRRLKTTNISDMPTDANLTKEDLAFGAKTAKEMQASYLSQTKLDENNRTGFENLQAFNRINAPNIPAPVLGDMQKPTFLNENIPMYGSNLQAPQLFQTQQITDQSKSLENRDFIASSQNFDRTSEYLGKKSEPGLEFKLQNFENQGVKSPKIPGFVQKNNPQEYLPPKDFFGTQPQSELSQRMQEAEKNQSILPFTSMSSSPEEVLTQAPEFSAQSFSFNKEINDLKESVKDKNILGKGYRSQKARLSESTGMTSRISGAPTYTPGAVPTALEGILKQTGNDPQKINQAVRSLDQELMINSPSSPGGNTPESEELRERIRMVQDQLMIKQGNIRDQQARMVGFRQEQKDKDQFSLTGEIPGARSFLDERGYMVNQLPEGGTISTPLSPEQLQRVNDRQNPLSNLAMGQTQGINQNIQQQTNPSQLSQGQNPMDNLFSQFNSFIEDLKNISQPQGTESERLKMQEAPREQEQEKESLNLENLKSQADSLGGSFEELKSKVEEAAESFSKIKDSKSENKENNQNQEQSKEIKISDVNANINVQTSPDTQTQAKIAAIQAVIEKLQAEIASLGQKVSGQVNPPRKG